MSSAAALIRFRQFARCVFLASLLSGVSRAGFTVFEASGANPAAITPTRDAFRTAVGGGTTAGANGSFGGARREINWDGVPDAFADSNSLPANFFNANSPRGVVFSTPGTGFLVSANAGGATPTLFGFPNDFQAFTAHRGQQQRDRCFVLRPGDDDPRDDERVCRGLHGRRNRGDHED